MVFYLKNKGKKDTITKEERKEKREKRKK